MKTNVLPTLSQTATDIVVVVVDKTIFESQSFYTAIQ